MGFLHFFLQSLNANSFDIAGNVHQWQNMKQEGLAAFPTRYKKKDRHGGIVVKRLVNL